MDTAFLYGSMKPGGGVLLASLLAIVGVVAVGLAIGVALGVARSRSCNGERDTRASPAGTLAGREAANPPPLSRRG